MSDQPNPKDYYASTAYKPAKRVAWEEANPDRQRISGSRLTWYRRTQDNGTKDEYGYNNITISKNWEAKRSELGAAGQNIFRTMKVQYDHSSIMPPNFKKIAKFIYFCTAISKGGVYICVFVLVLSFLTMPAVAALNSDFSKPLIGFYYIAIWVFPLSIVMLIIWKAGVYLSKTRSDVFFAMHQSPLWELSRPNGFFTIYNPKRAWEERLVAPIYEFDAYLESSPDTQGSPTYSLMLYHPETGLRQKLDAQFPPTNMPGELVAAWQFIQRYMDVSQPLPDVPALEIHRHKDPTTAAADQRKGRTPRYWRDMSEAEVEKIQEEKYQKNIRLR
ncbi:hypothetical protein [Vreelandella titanicae]|uniref:Uncharacterized protein n=1 Tax=Vreelandella titanicae TaxID=664683 RepID=A0A558J811_9GAMM|nr:hypothetical protein [Halomonas titanicae]TVU89780.1 hypothetical protein FQP89_10595 [Halomonas titanicae]